jgi:hypothetical protein
VQFTGEFAVSLFYIVISGFFINSENLVIIDERHIGALCYRNRESPVVKRQFSVYNTLLTIDVSLGMLQSYGIKKAGKFSLAGFIINTRFNYRL